MSSSHPYGSDPNNPYGGADDSSGSSRYGGSDQGPQAPQYGSQPGDHGDQAGYGQPQYGSQPSGYGEQPGGYGGQPGYGDQSGYGQPQYGSQPGGYGEQPPAYQTAGAYEQGSSDQFTPAYGADHQYGAYGSGYGYGGDNPKEKNIWGVLALVAGILALLGSFLGLIPFVGPVLGIIAFVIGVLALIFGIVGLNAAKKGRASNKGLSLTGLILGALSILLSIIFVILSSIWSVNIVNEAESAYSEAAEAPTVPTAPGGPNTDPAGEADPEDTAPVEEPNAEPDAASGEAVTLTEGVSMQVSVGEATVPDYAVGAEATNGEIAEVVVTITNDSDSSFDPGFPLVECSYSGGSCEDIFDGGDYSGALGFEPVPAGESLEVKMGFGVPHGEIDSMELEFYIDGSDNGYEAPYVFTQG
ncbi:hypothetical protein GCM10022261_29070 [Brevibacterium daeguense]|uniref:DUF4352 domain-containing protein n=1 Tax=Brevibacterium daeguense TaxID=909936 RepID=A0ABP8EMZ8_9MICO|nr:DUF308 domain-containing protein [Brevibacterium daeguense]